MIYFYEIDKKPRDEKGVKQEIDKEEISLMIWEVDDDLDGRISQEEFFNSYKRVLLDDEFLEPRKFENLVEFLMYNLYEVEKGKDDDRIEPAKRCITKEDCYKLMYIRNEKYLNWDSNEAEKEKKLERGTEMNWLFDGKPRDEDKWKTFIKRDETSGV